MAKGIAWTTFVLGLVHIVFGIVKFQLPLAEAVSAGFIDQFRAHDARSAAFWFLVSPLWSLLVLSLFLIAAGNARLG
jgi:hypothetical protein